MTSSTFEQPLPDDLAGRMTFMHEFREARDFPAESDHLPNVSLAQWASFGTRPCALWADQSAA